MATIKAYTDLEQSKKLAEILPLESADMFCADVFNKEKETHSYNFHILSTWGCNTFEELKGRENKFVCFIPAWGLSALLDVLPKGYSLGRRTTGKYYVCMTHIKHDISEFDNPIDACYDMIIHLSESNLL